MQTSLRFLVFLLMALMLASSPVFAGEQHVVSPSRLASTLADHIAQQDANRVVIHEALARPEVRAVASSLGVDLTRATAAVDTMSGVDLQRAASAAQQVNQQLVGGASTVVISTTTLIIALLLVIILILAIK